MTTEDGFLRAIAFAINDRLPRLVFADWLDEQGDPRAEWLRLTCELDELGPKDGRRPALEARKQALWDAHRDGLIGWERQFALARIQSKVARIPAEVVPFDPALHFRGESHFRGPLHPNPALSEAELLAFEAEYRVTLPDEYRLFLRQVGNGGLGPGDGLLRLADAVDRSPSRDLGTPFPFSIRQYREDPDRFYQGRSTEEPQPWPGVLYLSAPHEVYEYAYLVITGEDRGMMWGYGPINCGWTPECPSSDLDNKWAHGELRGFFRWYEEWLDDWLGHYFPKPNAGGGG
jgi:uncharacterized protein (TIGR02996 family)